MVVMAAYVGKQAAVHLVVLEPLPAQATLRLQARRVTLVFMPISDRLRPSPQATAGQARLVAADIHRSPHRQVLRPAMVQAAAAAVPTVPMREPLMAVRVLVGW